MPSVRIETRRWMDRKTKQAVLDAVHASLVTGFKIPDHDRNQRLVEYEPEDFEASAGKGEHFTVITIDAFAGRSVDAKRALYQALVSRLAPLGIPGNDVLVIVPRCASGESGYSRSARRHATSISASRSRYEGAVEQGDEADEALGGTRPGRHDWRGWRRRLVPARARNRGYRLAAYRQC